MNSPLRSFAAVFFGFVIMRIAALVLTLVFRHFMGLPTLHPTPAYLTANFVFSCIPVAIGGFATALLAPSQPLQHTYALAGVIFLLGALSYVRYAGAQPFWYQLVMQIVPPICALGGGFLVASASARQNR